MSQTYPMQYATPEEDKAWVREAFNGLVNIRTLTRDPNTATTLRITGAFLVDSSEAFAQLSRICREKGYTLFFRSEDGEPLILVVKGVARPKPNNRWLPIVLAVLTVLSVLGIGTLNNATQPGWEGFVAALPQGAAFAATLLAILVCHELGHYFMARHLGVATTPPYLIPMPANILGTMGAVIAMKETPPNRRAMLLIGAAGPLAGLVVAIPLLALGVALSPIETLPTNGGYVMEGNSLLYGLLKLVIHGEWLPDGARDVMLHPVAFAGWAGILVTSFNLMPIGQLDGGHAARALLGNLADVLNWIILGMMVIMGLTLWSGWLMWALLSYWVTRVKAIPLDDYTPLDGRDRALAALLIILFLLCFTPVPLVMVPPDEMAAGMAALLH